MHRFAAILIGTLAGALIEVPANAETANSNRGQRAFGACAACHSLEPDRNMTGPSLAELWNRKAGTLASFHRYSQALKSSGIVWNDKTLDEWLADPQHLVPGNTDMLRPPSLTRMYGPAVRRKRFRRSVGVAVLHQCIRPLLGAACAPGHHGYQRACVLISSPP